jgi:hypothetical protein
MPRHQEQLLMAEDDQNFIERADSASEKLHGQPMDMDMDKTAENFVLCGLKKRAGMLERFDTELRGEIDSSPHNLRRRVQLMELRRKMGSVHAALRKARR